jgi:hypothetical protein
MAKINFPNSPILDQEHIVGDRKWKWNGRAWIAVLGISSETTTTPTITYVSKTEASITFTVTNNDADPAIILYEKDDVTPDFNGVEVLGGATSGELSITGLDASTEYTVYASAVAATKLLSETSSFIETTLERTATPTINFVSKTENTITFTILNNDSEDVTIKWEQGNTTPEANTVSVLGNSETSNITLEGLLSGTEYIIYATAKAESKVISFNGTLTVTTNEPPTWIEATGGTMATYEVSGTFYKSHTFTTSSNFVVNSLSNQSGKNDVEYLVLAGGGGGASWYHEGGGGAGGYRSSVQNEVSGGNTAPESKITIQTQSYQVTVGSGGGGGSNGSHQDGGNGNESSVFGIISTGGGGGATGGTPKNGGSGGGGYIGSPGGLGIVGQGTDGGFGLQNNSGSNEAAGAGGGALNNTNVNALTTRGGNGGAGIASSITGTAVTRGGGGGGGVRNNTAGLGGAGGGGRGGSQSQGSPGSGQVNTGGGGGGAGPAHAGGNGGSGIVVIRYEVGSL